MITSRFLKYFFTNMHNSFKKIQTQNYIQYSTFNKTYTDGIQISELNLLNDYIKIKCETITMDFPLVWLRDNCQCEKCFHPDSKSRIIDWEYFDINVKPTSISLLNSKTINIKWTDGHLSNFDIYWLKNRSFLKENRETYTKKVYKLDKIFWSKSDFFSIFKSFDYNSILEENDKLKEWLKFLTIYGVALITKVPNALDSCRKLANRVEFLKRTHYGEEFIVQNKPGTTNVAYLSRNLQLHTDLPYYEYKPGANLLHCVTQTTGEGGDNLLIDGFYIADKLKKNNKAYYDILSETLIDWEDIGEENGNKFHSIYRSPVICKNSIGEIIRINYSTPQRGSHMNTDIEKVKPWYESLRSFVNMIYEEAVLYKLNEGEILCFDNCRLLHGRTGYKDTSKNTRYIVGCYLDWDFINSRFRILNSS